MNDEKEILKDLLVDDEDVKKQLANLVKQTKNIFQIQKKDGKILFQNFKDFIIIKDRFILIKYMIMWLHNFLNTN